MIAVALLVSSCASDVSTVEPIPSTTTSNPNGRVAGAPAEPGRTALDPSGGPGASVVHVLGSLELLPEAAPAWPTAIDGIGSDVATVVPLGCVPGSEECPVADVDVLEDSGIDVVSLATDAVASGEAEAVDAAAQELIDAGIAVIGWGENRTAAVQPMLVRGTSTVVAVHAISLSDVGDGATVATESEPGIAGPEALPDLLASIRASREAGYWTVVAVDWGDAEQRAPSDADVEVATTMIRSGADAVVGNGSDFLNRLEVIDDAPVAFGLGQAVTLDAEPLRRDTAVLRLVFTPEGERTCLFPATGGPDGPALDDEGEPSCP